jgi:hypothetical protein
MNKKTLIAITLIPFMIGLFGIITTYKKKNEFNNGKDVFAEVIEEPKDCEGLNYKYAVIKLKYKNKLFVKDVNQKHCPFLGQKRLKVRVNKTGDKLFFQEGDGFNGQLFSSFLILIIGVFCFFKLNKSVV